MMDGHWDWLMVLCQPQHPSPTTLSPINPALELGRLLGKSLCVSKAPSGYQGHLTTSPACPVGADHQEQMLHPPARLRFAAFYTPSEVADGSELLHLGKLPKDLLPWDVHPAPMGCASCSHGMSLPYAQPHRAHFYLLNILPAKRPREVIKNPWPGWIRASICASVDL